MELNYLMLLLVVFVVLAVWATVFWNKVTRQREEADKKLLLAHDLSAKANSILNSLDQEKEGISSRDRKKRGRVYIF